MHRIYYGCNNKPLPSTHKTNVAIFIYDTFESSASKFPKLAIRFVNLVLMHGFPFLLDVPSSLFIFNKILKNNIRI